MRVILMRGIPGSGKSTLVNERFPNAYRFLAPTKDLSEAVTADMTTMVISADDGCINEDGQYEYSTVRNIQNHRNCISGFIDALQGHFEQLQTLVVDNTNAFTVDISPYISIAEAYTTLDDPEHQLEVWTCLAPLEVCLARQTHNVPFEVMQLMDAALRGPWPTRFPPQQVHVTY